MNDPTARTIESLALALDIARRQRDEFEDAMHAMADESSRKLDIEREARRRAESDARNQRERRAALVKFVRAELHQFKTYRSGSFESAVERLVSQLHTEVAE